jgi:hypothetical protein
VFKGNWGNHDLKIVTDQVVCRVRSKLEYEEENEAFHDSLHDTIKTAWAMLLLCQLIPHACSLHLSLQSISKHFSRINPTRIIITINNINLTIYQQMKTFGSEHVDSWGRQHSVYVNIFTNITKRYEIWHLLWYTKIGKNNSIHAEILLSRGNSFKVM